MTRPYAFGDSEAAAQRLDLVAEVFEAPSRAFLQAWAPPQPRLAVDLGCGPGNTTALLAEVTGARRTVGLDASAAYVARATARFPALEFATHDALEAPFPTGPADVISCRYLVAHLPDPADAVTRWLTQLAPGGRLLVDEPHAIHAPHPVLERYEALVVARLEEHGTSMYPGDALDAVGPTHRQVVEHPVPIRDAAAMFGLNFAVWGDDPELAADLADVARTGKGFATWELYQAVFEAPA